MKLRIALITILTLSETGFAQQIRVLDTTNGTLEVSADLSNGIAAFIQSRTPTTPHTPPLEFLTNKMSENSECMPSPDETCPAPASGYGAYSSLENILLLERAFSLQDPQIAGNASSISPLPIPPNEKPALTPEKIEQQCSCLKDKYKTPSILRDKEVENKKIQEKVRTFMGQKLLNDYTRHFEDVRYYTVNFAGVFSKNESRRSDQAKKVQCNDEKLFRDAVSKNKSCKDNNISPEEKEIRLNGILTSHGKRLGDNFDVSLGMIEKQILSHQVELNPLGDQTKREQLDTLQFASFKKIPDSKISDAFLTKIMRNVALKDKLASKVLMGVTPFEAINQVVKEGFSNLKTMFNREELGDELYSKLESGISPQNSDLFVNQLNLSLSKVMNVHPGFARLMNDTTLFKDTLSELKSSQTVLSFIESDDLMNDHFENSCKTVIDDFSELVCASNDQLISKISNDELRQAANEPDKSESNFSQLLIVCDKFLTANPESAPGRFFNPNTDRESAYRHLITGSTEPTIDTLMLEGQKNPESSFGRALKAADEEFRGTGLSVPTDLVAREIFGKDFIERSEDGTTTDKNPPKATQNEKIVSTDNVATVLPAEVKPENLEQSNYSNNSSTQQTVNSAIPKIDNPKEMREFLANDLSEESASSISSNTSDEMMNELIRLKNETEKSKAKILELSADNEKLKLKAMEESLARVQRERAALEPGEPVVRATEPLERERSLQPSTLRENNRSIASSSQGETAGASLGNNSAALSPDFAGGGPASFNGVNRALLASSGNLGRSGDSSPVVVSSQTPRSGALEIKSQEVGLDLLNYITSNDSDIQTLINLKTSGIIYKYKVVEDGKVIEKEVLIDYKNLNDDVKKLIDKKIAENKNRNGEIIRLDREISELRRVYSYSALKIILGEQMKK